MAEAQDNNQVIYAALLDASKAFDVVWHDGMLLDIYELGITGDLWLIYKSMYSNMTSQVKWEREISEPFTEGQGVRQGGISSTELFKSRGNRLLTNIEDSNLGFHIGPTSVAAPACADDIILLSRSSTDLQTMLDIAAHDAAQKRYHFSASKTTTMVLNSRRPIDAWRAGKWWKLRDSNLSASMQEKHLGLIRDPSCKANLTISENIQKARRSCYALMGAGMHGVNGTHPVISIELWRTYALPQLIHGLELFRLTANNIKKLEICQNRTLRMILTLPNSTATCAVHLLSGIPPVQATIERSTLVLYRSLISNKTSKEFEIILRQLAIKNDTSHSWIVHIVKLLKKYDLPTAYEIMVNPPSKDQWKYCVKKAVQKHWTDKLHQEATDKSSLRYFPSHQGTLNRMHPIWQETPLNLNAVMRTHVVVRIMIGRYHLQDDMNKFRGTTVACPLCNSANENLMHFLYTCPSLDTVRSHYIPNIKNVYERHTPGYPVPTEDELTTDLFDPTLKTSNKDDVHQLRSIVRSFMYALHAMRSSLIVCWHIQYMA